MHPTLFLLSFRLPQPGSNFVQYKFRNIMDLSDITRLISTLRAQTARDSITPNGLGSILQRIVDAISSMSGIDVEDEEAILQRLSAAESNASTALQAAQNAQAGAAGNVIDSFTQSQDEDEVSLSIKQHGHSAKQVVLPAASSTGAGIMTATDKSHLDTAYGKRVNLMSAPSSESVVTLTITFGDGTSKSVTFVGATAGTGGKAGLMTKEQADQLAALVAAGPTESVRDDAGYLKQQYAAPTILRNVTDTVFDDLAIGDVYYDTGHLFYHTEDPSGDPDIGAPSRKVIYYCLADQTLYRWTGSRFVQAVFISSGDVTVPTKLSDLINDMGFLTAHQPLKTINGQTITGTGNITIDGAAELKDASNHIKQSMATPVVLRNVTATVFDDLNEGDTYFDSGHLFWHTEDPSGDPDIGAPSRKVIYFCLADGKMYRWNGNTFQPILATVATSGSYNDLSNKPTILSQSDVQDMIDDAVEDISGGVSKVKIGSTEYSPNINGVVDISSGVSAAQPTIDPNTGNWIVNGQVTQYPSQGAQGNSGYTGAANELEVVNNLTDGGATKALSAEMGKVLGARHLYVTEDATHININIASSLQVLNVSPLTLAFNAQVGGNQSKTISISGESVSGNVTLEVDGSTMFTLSQNSISPVGGGVDSTVTVTYFPVGKTTQNATLNVKVGNNIVGVVRLQGVAAIPSLSLSASSLGIYGSSASSTVYVIGSLLSGNVVGVSSSADFSINPSTISAADINAAGAQGVPVVISRVSGASANDATVTFTDSADGLSASLGVTYEGTPAVDDIITKGGIRYKVLANNKLEVEHSTGTTADPSTYSGDVFTIPSTVTWAGTDYTVSSIGNSAFYKSQIRQVIIPNTIESVEYRAFSNMSALQYLDLPDSVTSVGNYVQNDPLLIRLTVPKNATHSAQWVYTSCTIQTMIVPTGTTNPFSQGYSLSGTTIGTMRIETTSGTASGENGVLCLNANFSYQKSQVSKLQVPTGMKQYYSDSSKTHAGRWLKLLGWNGSDNGASADTLTAAIAKIEEITVS